MAKTIVIDSIQEHFLKCAIELNEAVLNFGVTAAEFKRSYGYTKTQAREQLKQLTQQLYGTL